MEQECGCVICGQCRELERQGRDIELDTLRARLAEVGAERDRLRIDLLISHRALDEAGKRFANGDMEGTRLLLCDMNARSNAAALNASKGEEEE